MRVFGRKFALRGAALVAALGLSLTLGSGTAHAVTISPGGPFSGTSGTFSIGTPPAGLACSSSHITGNFLSSPIGGQIGTATPSMFSGCVAYGFPVSVTLTKSPWALYLTGVNPSNPNQFYGNATGIGIKITGVGCTVSFVGSAPLTWTNPNALKFVGTAPTLTATAANCLGLINVGDTLPLTASYTVSPPQIIT